MTTPLPAGEDPLDAPTAALAAAVLEVARHVDAEALPRPRWYALAKQAELLADSPGLASLLGAEAPLDELSLTPIELDESTGAPDAHGPADPLDGLAGIMWPTFASGGAIAVDLEGSAWEVRGEAGTAGPPAAGTLRVLVAALADGTTWSAIRRPGEQGFHLGAALIPALTSALLETVRAD